MATIWKTVTSKITDETYGDMKVICEKDNIRPNEFIRTSIEKSVGSKLNKDLNPAVFPGMGENKFEYDPESDSFMWLINFGSGNTALISGKLSPFFVENIFNALKEGMDKRNAILKKIKKKAYIPEAIIKFREK